MTTIITRYHIIAPIVGDMIIHRIFDMPKEADTDFGKYVEQTF